MQISLRRMVNKKWRWQTDTGTRPITPGDDVIGGGIFDPNGVDYDTAEDACAAAIVFLERKGVT